MKWWNPRRIKYEFNIHQKDKCIGIWWNEQWIDENLEGLTKSLKHSKWPNALEYDEMINKTMN